ncbi:hypothetical protein [Kribbella catacumbae]|uniref:hypothetical protein n=1 Tax=Kribbella catacumbae TaxID=460086 RepID=UPI000A07AF2B|nr:hypothetical protein [Kribbella catacumbae]
MTGSDPSQPARRRTRPAVIIAAAAAVALVSAVLSGLATGYFDRQSESGGPAVPLPAASTTPTQRPSTATLTPSPTTSKPTPTATSKPTSAPTSTPIAPRPFKYQPLWPFASVDEAAAWQREYRSGGQQPWHLDAGLTALSFTNGFLGFKEIDQVVSRTIRGDDAQISVGYHADEGPYSVSAVIHLVRIGQGSDAPWEVVGTIDNMLTLERPKYGASVLSPLTVGGRITGVDESLRVEVRQPSSEQPLGTYCCLPGGGTRQPWTAKVSYKGATDPALTIVVSTGGHIQDVERFAITGVRP